MGLSLFRRGPAPRRVALLDSRQAAAHFAQSLSCLRPGGLLILREAAFARSEGHRRVDFWERVATWIGHIKTGDGLHFRTLVELGAELERAGLADWKIRQQTARSSNVLLLAWTSPTQSSAE